MKVAFDEHVPAVIAKVFIALSKERTIRKSVEGLEFKRAKDYAPKTSDADFIRKSDVPWIDRFAADGGMAIISGDVMMRERTHEQLALRSHGFVVIFFERKWANWGFYKKSSLMLHWWEMICEKIKVGSPGTFWVVPNNWPVTNCELRNESTGLAKLLKDKIRKSPLRKVRKPKKRDKKISIVTPLTDIRQAALLIGKERESAAKER